MYIQYCTYRFQWCDLTKAPYLKTKYFHFGVSSQICLRNTASIHNTIHSQSYKMLGQKATSRAWTLFVLLVERIRLFFFFFSNNHSFDIQVVAAHCTSTNNPTNKQTNSSQNLLILFLNSITNVSSTIWIKCFQ